MNVPNVANQQFVGELVRLQERTAISILAVFLPYLRPTEFSIDHQCATMAMPE